MIYKLDWNFFKIWKFASTAHYLAFQAKAFKVLFFMQTESFLFPVNTCSSFGGSEKMLPRSFSNEYCDEDYIEAWFSFLFSVLDLVSLSKNSSDENVTSRDIELIDPLCFNKIIG